MRKKRWIPLFGLSLVIAGCGGQTDAPRDGGVGHDAGPDHPGSDDAASERQQEEDVAPTDGTSQDGDAAFDIVGDRTTPPDASDADAVSPPDASDGDAVSPPDASDGDAVSPPDAPTGCVGPTFPNHLLLWVDLGGGAKDSCASIPIDGSFPPSAHRTVSGVVRNVTATPPTSYAVSIDTCNGDACGPQNVVFNIVSPRPVTIPADAFVEAEYWINRSWDCSYFMRFSNLPEWNGQPNPVSNANKIYFVGSDGLVNPNAQIASINVNVELLPLGCQPDAGLGCGGGSLPVDTYVYRFSYAGSELTLPMGQSMPFIINQQSVLVTNLRSYQSSFCDDYSNWAFVFEGL